MTSNNRETKTKQNIEKKVKILGGPRTIATTVKEWEQIPGVGLLHNIIGNIDNFQLVACSFHWNLIPMIKAKP